MKRRIPFSWIALASGLALYFVAAIAFVTFVMPMLGEGPFAISIENRSGEQLLVTTRQVGATSGSHHQIEPQGEAHPSWGSCAPTDVIVKRRGNPDGTRRNHRVISRQRFDICDGDQFVIAEDLEVTIECGARTLLDERREEC